jgi:deazaflavin-dependent oxidoreductase (nitroreductase family)
MKTYRTSKGQSWANAVMTWLLRHGRGPSFIWLLTAPGRVSGVPRTTPVVPVQRADQRWVVAPFGAVDWVRNVRAAGRLELHRGREHHTYEARELESTEAVPVLRDYLSMRTGRYVKDYFDVSPSSSAEAIAAEAARHPVFALTPAEPGR